MTLEVCAERAYDWDYKTFAHTTDTEDQDNELTLELQFEKRHVFYFVQLVFYRCLVFKSQTLIMKHKFATCAIKLKAYNVSIVILILSISLFFGSLSYDLTNSITCPKQS